MVFTAKVYALHQVGVITGSRHYLKGHALQRSRRISMNFILRDVRRLALMGLLLLGLCVANGAQAQTITLSDRYVSTTYGHYGSTALYVLSYNGDIITSAPSGTSQIDVGDWLTPK